MYLRLSFTLVACTVALGGCVWEKDRAADSEPFASESKRAEADAASPAATLESLRRDKSVVREVSAAAPAIEDFCWRCQRPGADVFATAGTDFAQIRLQDKGRLIVERSRIWLALDDGRKFSLDRADLSQRAHDDLASFLSQASKAAYQKGADRQAELLAGIFAAATRNFDVDQVAATESPRPPVSTRLVTDEAEVVAALLDFCNECASAGTWLAEAEGFDEYIFLPKVGRATLDSSELTISYLDGRTYRVRVAELSAERKAVMRSAFASLTAAARTAKQSKSKS